MIKEIKVRTDKKQQTIDITNQVKKIVKESKVKEGIASVFVPHATAAIIINENYDPNVCIDIINALDKLIPEGIWLHDRIDDNAAAHIKSAIIGCSQTIPIQNHELQLGRWQSIQLIDFDGPRERNIKVTIVRNFTLK